MQNALQLFINHRLILGLAQIGIMLRECFPKWCSHQLRGKALRKFSKRDRRPITSTGCANAAAIGLRFPAWGSDDSSPRPEEREACEIELDILDESFELLLL
jgi:hypothetical protein